MAELAAHRRDRLARRAEPGGELPAREVVAEGGRGRRRGGRDEPRQGGGVPGGQHDAHGEVRAWRLDALEHRAPRQRGEALDADELVRPRRRLAPEGAIGTAAAIGTASATQASTTRTGRLAVIWPPGPARVTRGYGPALSISCRP